MYMRNVLRRSHHLGCTYHQLVFQLPNFHPTSVINYGRQPIYTVYGTGFAPVVKCMNYSTTQVRDVEPDLTKLDQMLNHHVAYIRQYGFTVPSLLSAVDEIFYTVFDDALKHQPDLLYRSRLSSLNLHCIHENIQKLKMYYTGELRENFEDLHRIILQNEAQFNGMEALYLLNKLFLLGLNREDPVFASLLCIGIQSKDSLTLGSIHFSHLFTHAEMAEIYHPMLRKALDATEKLSSQEVSDLLNIAKMMRTKRLLPKSLSQKTYAVIQNLSKSNLPAISLVQKFTDRNVDFLKMLGKDEILQICNKLTNHVKKYQLDIQEAAEIMTFVRLINSVDQNVFESISRELRDALLKEAANMLHSPSSTLYVQAWAIDTLLCENWKLPKRRIIHILKRNNWSQLDQWTLRILSNHFRFIIGDSSQHAQDFCRYFVDHVVEMLESTDIQLRLTNSSLLNLIALSSNPQKEKIYKCIGDQIRHIRIGDQIQERGQSKSKTKRHFWRLADILVRKEQPIAPDISQKMLSDLERNSTVPLYSVSAVSKIQHSQIEMATLHRLHRALKVKLLNNQVTGNFHKAFGIFSESNAHDRYQVDKAENVLSHEENFRYLDKKLKFIILANSRYCHYRLIEDAMELCSPKKISDWLTSGKMKTFLKLLAALGHRPELADERAMNSMLQNFFKACRSNKALSITEYIMILDMMNILARSDLCPDDFLKQFFSEQTLIHLDEATASPECRPRTLKMVQDKFDVLNVYAALKAPHLGIPWLEYNHQQELPRLPQLGFILKKVLGESCLLDPNGITLQYGLKVVSAFALSTKRDTLTGKPSWSLVKFDSDNSNPQIQRFVVVSAGTVHTSEGGEQKDLSMIMDHICLKLLGYNLIELNENDWLFMGDKKYLEMYFRRELEKAIKTCETEMHEKRMV